MAEQEKFMTTVESLFEGLESFLTSKTVAGEPINVGDTVIIPLADVSFGVGAGVFGNDQANGGGGLGGKMRPDAVIIIQNGNARLVKIDSEKGFEKIVDMVPGILDRFTGHKDKKDKKDSKEEE
jgi:uncharacterized spore protein YtfJ